MRKKVKYILAACVLLCLAIIPIENFLNNHLDNRYELEIIKKFVAGNCKLSSLGKWKITNEEGFIAYLTDGSIKGDYYFSNSNNTLIKEVIKVSWLKTSSQSKDLQVSVYDISGSGSYKLLDEAIVPLKR